MADRLGQGDLRYRTAMSALLEAVGTARVTVVTGPRQAGKTTIASQVLDELGTGTLRSLDDDVLLQAALDDPGGFVTSAQRPVVIDEIQRGGDALVRAIKVLVDRDRTAGQFILTGSADFLTVPTLSESLAGRAAFVDLWPFSQGELEGRRDRFIDMAFADPDRLREQDDADLGPLDYFERLCVGGFPEVQAFDNRSRSRWFRDYVRTVTQREIVELSGIRKAHELPRLLRLLAARTSGEIVMQHVIDDAQLARQAVYDYTALLEMTYLITLIPAWSRNVTKKMKRHSKIYMTDPGLAAYLLGKEPLALARPGERATGALLETFVLCEIVRQAGWSDTAVNIHHFRDRDGAEVDLVLEAPDGRIVAIEVKSGTGFRREAFRWLTMLRDRTGDDFVHGFVLYAGSRSLPFGDRLTALPVASLWRTS